MGLARFFIPRRKDNVFAFLIVLSFFCGAVYFYRINGGYISRGTSLARRTEWGYRAQHLDPNAPGENGAGVVLREEDKEQVEKDMKTWFMNVKAR
ncbi:hypothetical protein NECAME_00914 [Necator americanus]|uniref:Uncharacterized protein n=1 Tax=Necator americanus TaxID=51031 RepID=W2SNI9_NECAM|nr:hypothetical protein NECAME_00914 [Necator americanus]ETN71225.1 hypothetical protein NECAME_00914 [Necator americanus]